MKYIPEIESLKGDYSWAEVVRWLLIVVDSMFYKLCWMHHLLRQIPPHIFTDGHTTLMTGDVKARMLLNN